MERIWQYLRNRHLPIESETRPSSTCARNVTSDCRTDSEKIKQLFYFCARFGSLQSFHDFRFEEDFKASRVLEWGKGYCVQKAVLLTALARAAGVPSRLVFARIRNHRVPEHIVKMTGTNIFPRHGYNQFHIDGKWISAAATFDRYLCEKNGLTTVEFDGTTDAVLPEKDLAGKPYIEYVEKFPASADLPFEWIATAIRKRVGPDKRPWLTREDSQK